MVHTLSMAYRVGSGSRGRLLIAALHFSFVFIVAISVSTSCLAFSLWTSARQPCTVSPQNLKMSQRDAGLFLSNFQQGHQGTTRKTFSATFVLSLRTSCGMLSACLDSSPLPQTYPIEMVKLLALVAVRRSNQRVGKILCNSFFNAASHRRNYMGDSKQENSCWRSAGIFRSLEERVALKSP